MVVLRRPEDPRVHLVDEDLVAQVRHDAGFSHAARPSTVAALDDAAIEVQIKKILVPTATNASWMNPIECRFTESAFQPAARDETLIAFAEAFAMALRKWTIR